jgi:hypothetical protein
VQRCICVEKKKQLYATEWIIAFYNMLNMFRALLCRSSGARDYKCVTTAYGVQCLVAGCRRSGAGQQAVRPGRGMLHDLRRAASLFLDSQPAALHLTPDDQQPSTARHRR